MYNNNDAKSYRKLCKRTVSKDIVLAVMDAVGIAVVIILSGPKSTQFVIDSNMIHVDTHNIIACIKWINLRVINSISKLYNCFDIKFTLTL